MLTNVAFFILSSTTTCASHIAFTTNQNWSGSSFPTPLNIKNFIVLSILKYGVGRGGVGGDGGDDGETSGGVGGRGMHEIHCLIRLIALLEETFTISSSLSRCDKIKGLFSISALPLFLYILPLCVVPKINLFE